MRMKLRSLQMILPRCFQLMGKHQYVSGCQYQPIDDRPPGGPPNTITKLIKLDGLVRIYRRPVHVSELMREFPKHMVCPSDSFYIGQRIPALSEQDQLELGHNYFLLPKHLCESALSIVTIASWSSSSGNSSISDTNKITTAALIRKKKKKAASSLSPCQQAVKQPFDIQKTASGCLRIRVSEEFIISQLIMEMEEEKEDEEELKSKSSNANIGICTTEQLKKDYSQLVGWSRQRQWKPKLEMIRESTRETKSQRPRRAVPAVLLLSSSFKGSTTNIKRLIVRKKKKKKKKSQSSKKNHASFEPQHLQVHQVVSSPSSSSSSSVKKDRTKRLSSSSGTSTRLDKKERNH